MKSYTSIEQSKKLAEILPVESADMYYPYVLPKSDRIKHNPEIGNPVNALKWYNEGYTMSRKEPITLDEYGVPCWSLAALLDQLEDVVVDENGYEYQLQIIKEGVQYYLVYEGVDDFASYETSLFDDLVDACVEMIIRLKEKDLL